MYETEALLRLPDPPTCIIFPDDYAAIGGINILKAYNAISDEQYNALYISEKQIREKVVGNMQRSNKELIHIIKSLRV